MREKIVKRSTIASFVLVLILVLFVVPRIGSADPSSHIMWFEIQGAHVVSEGAYFRFCMTSLSPRMSFWVSVNDSALMYIQFNKSVNYDVIAPQISSESEQVTYTFKGYYNYTEQLNDYDFMVNSTVLVLNSSYFSDNANFTFLTNSLTAIGLVTVVAAFIMWQKRRL
jgi:hypothetical protein